MAIYGLYIHDLAAGDLVWFTSDHPLEPGTYALAAHTTGSPEVYVAESIPALVLMVGPLIDKAELSAQRSFSTPDIPSDVQRHIASEMTDNLLRRLTETSSIWVSNPRWLNDLRPVSSKRQ